MSGLPVDQRAHTLYLRKANPKDGPIYLEGVKEALRAKNFRAYVLEENKANLLALTYQSQIPEQIKQAISSHLQDIPEDKTKNQTMKNFHLTIATLERVVFDEDVNSVTLPGLVGEFGILAGHAPLITPLKLGEISAKKDGEEFLMTISGGMVEVQPSRTLVLADQAERAEEIDEKLAEEARARAEKIMQEKRGDEQAFAQAAAELERTLLRLKIVRKHRKLI